MTGDAGAGIPASVDLFYAADGVRARHIPGVVDLATRRAVVTSVPAPGADLAVAIDAVIAGDSSPLAALKIDPVDGVPRACACGGRSIAVCADIALGPNLGLVVERVDSRFCFSCGTLDFPDSGKSVRDRLARWRDARAEPDRAEPSLSYETDEQPRAVQIEVTTRCNLACAYCSHGLLPSTADLDWPEFERTIGGINFEHVDIVDFTGLGEAILNRLLPRMIAEVARRGPHLSLRVVSNAVAGSPSRWGELIDAGLTSIAFSIDTLDPERFARQRGGASLDKALRTVVAVAELRRNATRPLALRIKAVLLDDVYREAEALMRWSLGTGLDMPQFSTLDRRDTAQSLYDSQPWLVHALEGEGEAEAFEAWAQSFWLAAGGQLADAGPAPRRYRHPRLLTEPPTCRWITDASYVAVNGEMLTCCESMIDMPRQVVGSLTDRKLSEVWQDDLLWNYRLPLMLGHPPRGCVGCPQAPMVAAAR